MPPQMGSPEKLQSQKFSFMTNQTRRQSASCSSPLSRCVSHRQNLMGSVSRHRRRWVKWNCVNITLLIAGGALAAVSAVFLFMQSGFAATSRATNMSESQQPNEVVMIVNNVVLGTSTISGRPWRVLRTVKHDRSCFTQGLELMGNDTMIEACGLYGQSRLRSYRVRDIERATDTAASPALEDFVSHYFFAEGITVEGNQIHMLTWKENVMISFDATTLKELNRIEYPLEGWGLAYDIEKDLFYATDGSSKIYWLKRLPTSMTVKKVVPVTCNNLPVPKLNELEFDQKNRFLYANVWYSTKLYKLDVVTGLCEAVYDMKPLLEPDADSMNGIALVYRNPMMMNAAANGTALVTSRGPKTNNITELKENPAPIKSSLIASSSTLSPMSTPLSHLQTTTARTNASTRSPDLERGVNTTLMWVTGKLWSSMHLVELFP